MAKIRLAGTFPVNSGDWNSMSAPSCCYIPGSSGFNPAYFGITASVRLAVTDENDVYIALNGGSCGGGGSGLYKNTPWYVHFGFDKHAFTVDSYDDLPNRQSRICELGAGVNGADVWVDATIPNVSAVNVGDDASALGSGWYYAGKVEDLERDGNSAIYLYVAYPVENTGGTVNTLDISSYQIRIDDSSVVPSIFEYYPWGRIISNEWRSHNRQGGSLKRYNSGWQDVKNTYGSTANSKGFRYNGSSWDISPVTGRE